ncbi:hypothetical protein F441_11753, partial [Phytophthora nicotianae CJ01A1]
IKWRAVASKITCCQKLSLKASDNIAIVGNEGSESGVQRGSDGGEEYGTEP